MVKRAWPCSSRLIPVFAPIGFSGAFSRVGRRVFSAHSFSPGEGWRPSNTSAIGFSATGGLEGFLSGIGTPPASIIEEGCAAGKVPTYRVGRTLWSAAFDSGSWFRTAVPASLTADLRQKRRTECPLPLDRSWSDYWRAWWSVVGLFGSGLGRTGRKYVGLGQSAAVVAQSPSRHRHA